MKKATWFNGLLVGSAMVCSAQAGTIGFWRMEESGKVSGDAIVTVANSQGAAASAAGFVGATGALAPVYSDDVAGATVYDPITGTTYANGKSMLVGGGTGLANYVSGLKVNNTSSALDTGTGSFTVEFFFKETTVAGAPVAQTYYSQIVRRAGMNNGSVFAVQMGGTPDFRPYARIGAGTPTVTYQDVASATSAMNDAQWHHVAMVYNADEQKEYIYLDYVNVGSRAVTVAFDNTSATEQLRFGRATGNATDGANNWYVDELRYSSGALNASQFLQLPEPASVSLLAVGGMLMMNRRK